MKLYNRNIKRSQSFLYNVIDLAWVWDRYFKLNKTNLFELLCYMNYFIYLTHISNRETSLPRVWEIACYSCGWRGWHACVGGVLACAASNVKCSVLDRAFVKYLYGIMYIPWTLKMPCDKNMPGFWICQGYTRFWTCVSMLLNNARICLNMSETESKITVQAK